MNLAVVCSGCGEIYRVVQASTSCASDVALLVGESSEFWPNKYVCPRCGAQATGMQEEELPRSMQTCTIIDLSPEELYAALHGLGLPSEQATTFLAVCELLSCACIVRVVGADVTGTGRCSIDYIQLDTGVKVYFGASREGAVIYRIVRPGSYASRVEQEA
jgi:hypothetical protein